MRFQQEQHLILLFDSDMKLIIILSAALICTVACKKPSSALGHLEGENRAALNDLKLELIMYLRPKPDKIPQWLGTNTFDSTVFGQVTTNRTFSPELFELRPYWKAAGNFVDTWGTPYTFALLETHLDRSQSARYELKVWSLGPNRIDENGMNDDLLESIEFELAAEN